MAIQGGYKRLQEAQKMAMKSTTQYSYLLSCKFMAFIMKKSSEN
jgi:hypothetical protein